MKQLRRELASGRRRPPAAARFRSTQSCRGNQGVTSRTVQVMATFDRGSSDAWSGSARSTRAGSASRGRRHDWQRSHDLCGTRRAGRPGEPAFIRFPHRARSRNHPASLDSVNVSTTPSQSSGSALLRAACLPRAAKNILRITLRMLVPLLVVVGLAGGQLFTSQSAFAADPPITDFENFAAGDVNGQAGWTSGHGSSTCPVYDVAVVPNTYGYPSFGTQSLRISNAITCGSFNDQTFSSSLANEAGETSADVSTFSGGTRQSYFEAQWDFASTVPGSEQPGLSVVASPDRGDPGRMSWLQMVDTPAVGLRTHSDCHGSRPDGPAHGENDDAVRRRAL